MAVWVYGVGDQGDPQLLGPFESDDDANSAAEGLNGVRLVYASTREEAIAQLQGRSRPQRRAEPAHAQPFDDFGFDDFGEAAALAEDDAIAAEADRDG